MAKIIKFVRITVGDASVCPDCINLQSVPAMSYPRWQSSGLAPRVASTQCQKAGCRCGLVPDSIEGIKEFGKQKIDKFIKSIEDKILADLTTGYKIRMKDFENIKGLTTFSYATIANMEALISQWKVENNFDALPKEWFDLAEITKMTKWLKDRVD